MKSNKINAISLFELAFKKVPGYRRFLKSKNFDPGLIKNLEDFKKLPITDKKSYLQKYSLGDLFCEGKFPPIVYASSGSSGKPTFWFRGDEQETRGGDIHRTIFEKIFGINKNDPTLVVICFSMGVWVAGNYTATSCRQLAQKGFNLSIISPALDKEDIFNALRNLAPLYKNLVIAGYPPFIMDVINEALAKGINLPENVKFLTAGDKFSEGWRDSLMKLLGKKNESTFAISLYGSADALVLGHETPLSIFIRRESLKDQKLYYEIFGEESTLPALVQYDPDDTYFEEIDGELVITAPMAIPLVRYNIHDRGKIISHIAMKDLLIRYGLIGKAGDNLKDWELPFIVLKGRTDVAVTFYAINIYPEHIKAGLEAKSISRFLTGSFVTHNKTLNKGKDHKLYVDVELVQDVASSEGLRTLINNELVKKLIEFNIEYRKLYFAIDQKAVPTLRLVDCGKLKATDGIIYLKGKKPKVVL